MQSFRKERKPMFARVARVNGEIRTFEEMPFYITMPDGTRRKIECVNDLVAHFMMIHGATEEEYVRAIAILDIVANKEKFVKWCVSNKEASVEELLNKCIELREEIEAKRKTGAVRKMTGTVTVIEKEFCSPMEVQDAGRLFTLVAVNGVPLKHKTYREQKDGSVTSLGEKCGYEVVRGGIRLVKE